MALIVQKYGGSSVADADKMHNVADRIIRTAEKGNRVVVTVSAMGKTTDNLIALAESVANKRGDREMDMLLSAGEIISSSCLAMTLTNKGFPAISLSGRQAGIATNDVYASARIENIEPQRIFSELADGKIVIVAGFQGINANDDIATLGRGGSDTTAVALAASIKADACEIYTDVEGVFSADPHIVPEATYIPEITYEEMLELSSLGAKVMQVRSIEFANKYEIDVWVRSSFSETAGTRITKERADMEKPIIRGITSNKKESRLTICDLANRPGIAAHLFGCLAEANINVDMIVQSSSAGSENKTDISFTVGRDDYERACLVSQEESKFLGGGDVSGKENVAKVTAVGIGMRNHPGVAAKMFAALSGAGINIEMITTSEIRISCIVAADQADQAVRVVHETFGLGTK